MNIEAILLFILLCCVNFCVYYRQWKIQIDINQIKEKLEVLSKKK